MVLRDCRKQWFLIIWTTYRMPFLIVLMRQLAYCLPLIPPLFLEYVIVLYSFIRCSAGGFRQQPSFQLHWPLHKGGSLQTVSRQTSANHKLHFSEPFTQFHDLRLWCASLTLDPHPLRAPSFIRTRTLSWVAHLCFCDLNHLSLKGCERGNSHDKAIDRLFVCCLPDVCMEMACFCTLFCTHGLDINELYTCLLLCCKLADLQPLNFQIPQYRDMKVRHCDHDAFSENSQNILQIHNRLHICKKCHKSGRSSGTFNSQVLLKL